MPSATHRPRRYPIWWPALVVVAAAACAPPPAPPAAPAPVAGADSARRDSLARVAAARRDSVARAEVAARVAADSARAAAGARTLETPADRTRVRLARRAGVVRVCAGGDVTLGTNLDTSWVRTASRREGRRVSAFPDPNGLLAPLRPLLGDADVVLLNVEGAIGEGPATRKCRPGSTACFAFRQPVPVARALRDVASGAIVVGNVANNHSRDAGPAGFRATQRHMRAAGVHVTGADTLPTLVVSPAGDTVAVLGFGTSPNGPDARDLAAVRRHVRRAAEAAERVIVTMHLGAEGRGAQRTRRGVERFHGVSRGDPVAFAEAAVEAGADLVVGHGPHVLRAAEWRGDALAAYSLGNLVTYGPFSNGEPIKRGALLCAALGAADGVLEAVLRPTVQRQPGRVDADPAMRAAVLVDSLSRLDFPRTGARVRADGLLTKRGVESAGER
ncbi:MAG TPA: CapA family protein [Gemmatimonadaceae bacterium]|nr:CapA family protein [Gemmatimonadaceae bacterium]